jgi:hypothetical protein
MTGEGGGTVYNTGDIVVSEYKAWKVNIKGIVWYWNEPLIVVRWLGTAALLLLDFVFFLPLSESK